MGLGNRPHIEYCAFLRKNHREAHSALLYMEHMLGTDMYKLHGREFQVNFHELRYWHDQTPIHMDVIHSSTSKEMTFKK